MFLTAPVTATLIMLAVATLAIFGGLLAGSSGGSVMGRAARRPRFPRTGTWPGLTSAGQL